MITTKASLSNAVTEREARNRRLALESAAESIVLLGNDGVLPLAPCPIALYGAGAAYTIKGGSGSGEVNVRHAVSALEGLENAGYTILTKDWINRYDEIWKAGKESFLKKNRKKLKLSVKVLADLMAAEYRYPAGDRLAEKDLADTDACLYVLSRQSGEGHDRKDEPGSFRLDETEIHNIRFCAAHYAQFVLVINTGAVIDLSPLDGIGGIRAIVYMNQLGMEGGNALASVLSGAKTPCGKLAVSWPKKYEDVPFGGEFAKPDETRAAYKEGVYVGYRYFDSFGVSPRYPFGYGKSYSSFAVQTESVFRKGDAVTASVRVTNTGAVAGKEIVQLYVSCPQTGMDREFQRLVAFGKTGLLAPGEAETLTLSFSLSVLSCYDEAAKETILEAGNYLVRVGQSSRDTQAVAVIRIDSRIVLSQHKALFPTKKPVTELRSRIALSVPAGLPVLTVPSDLFATKFFSYGKAEESIPDDVSQKLLSLSTGDHIRFCVGTGLFGEQAGFRVPGAVGHTTTAYLDRGIPNIELCDGPAGLRLQRRSTRGKKGKIKPVDTSISLYEFLPKYLTGFLLGNPEKEQMLYQYVTGFPVAAALAQSWNTDLLHRIGQAVSAEMTEFGVKVWLAPALNLIRNPLCGRNYEYYSEDPLLSGKLAAAITCGVQETPGNCVTVKHFAANNQEENRYFVSSDMDERALRELYLKGFEIVVKEGQPRALMTAYNKINGTYCAESHALCTDILRTEWGFTGAVMTDWLSTGADRANEAEAIKAGVDLIMPGGKKPLAALTEATKDDPTLRRWLARACGRVLQLILN